ncbi:MULTISPECIES: FkbM family methyltransferase [Burkholderia]|nr:MULTISPECIES: FkbM family methyltransferase [Burkholderia]
MPSDIRNWRQDEYRHPLLPVNTFNEMIIQLAEPYLLVETRHGPMLVNRHDIYIGNALIDYGEYSELETQFLLQLIRRPGTIVEVGANIGSQTVPLAAAAKAVGADVVALEPQPFVFQNLCANLALNAISNVTAWPMACGSEPGTLGFTLPDYHRAGNFGAVSMQPGVSATRVEVPCIRLDDMLSKKEVQLMKIDVEGFELHVLAGARQTIMRSRPAIYIENDRADNSRALIEYLWELDYRLWWHITPLFNPDNFRSNTNNRYPGISAFNMIGFPRDSDMKVIDAEEIRNSGDYPLVAR